MHVFVEMCACTRVNVYTIGLTVMYTFTNLNTNVTAMTKFHAKVLGLNK